jgi:inositol transport system ATP-binding protein
MSDFLLSAKEVSKGFPGVVALDKVSLCMKRGEVHALLGENGAGKSTLLKILSGAYHQDAGTIEFDGQVLCHQPPFERQRLGIVTVYQEFNLMPNMSIAENVFVGREPGKAKFVNWAAMRKAAGEAIAKLDLHIDPRTPVNTLSVAEQQMVEIVRALTIDAKLIILDEPTAALSDREVAKLHRIVRDLKSHGIGIIYVTHRLNEVSMICDRFTVLRDGQFVAEGEVAETSTNQIIRMMVGRDVEYLSGDDHPLDGEVVLRIEQLTRVKRLPSSQAVPIRQMSLDIRRGQILGLAGLVGAGRTDLMRALLGAEPYDSGTLFFEGKSVQIKTPTDAINFGIALVPEDRKQQGLFLTQSVRSNMTLPILKRLCVWRYFVNERAEHELVERFRKDLRIRMPNHEAIVGTLSGGNQQKVILARCLALEPKVLIVDEPTRGIDIGAKAEVHQLLRNLASDGKAVVVISSELPEILSLCDRIVTVKEGRITADMPVAEASEEKLMKFMALGARETHAHSELGATDETITMAKTATPEQALQRQRKSTRWMAILEKFGVVIFLLLLILFFTSQNERFLSVRNLFNILADVSIYGIMAVGMTFVILTAGIDLSVGSLLALCSMCGAAVIKGTGESRYAVADPHAFGGCSWLVALLICLVIGTAAGYIQGKATTKLCVPPFVVTLGGMTVWRGGTLLVAGGSPISGFDPAYRWWGTGQLFDIPVPVIVFFVVVLAGYILLRHTQYGRQVYAVGGNPEAARLSGLRVDRVLTTVYVLMGFLAGLAGFVLSARLSSAEAVAGEGYELRVIASVVIGGTSLFGGLGGIAGTVVGTVLIGVLLNGLVIMNVNPYYQQIIIGIIIVLAVAFDTFAKRSRGR